MIAYADNGNLLNTVGEALGLVLGIRLSHGNGLSDAI
jgi:hypothetical protein